MSEGNAVEGEKIEKLTTIKYSERDKEKGRPGKRKEKERDLASSEIKKGVDWPAARRAGKGPGSDILFYHSLLARSLFPLVL